MHDLTSLTKLLPLRSGSVSAENPTGGAGAGGRATEGTGADAARNLGQGWKVSPSIDLPGRSRTNLADLTGEGRITHIWLTCDRKYWRRLVIRAYWDGDEEPAVEVPLGDFFCNGWGRFAQVSSVAIAANPHGGFNSYWPMPFATAARIEIENLVEDDVRLYFQIDFEHGDGAFEGAYFHSQWRRSKPLALGAVHTLVDVEGRGHYAGTYLCWGVNDNGWWGEGEVKFFLDDDEEFPSICGTGTEDYFGGAWNFDVPGRGYTEFSTPFLGMPQVIRPDGLYSSQQRFGLYRWHLPDPVRFTSRLRATVQALGWRSDGTYRQLQDDIASTATFYLDRTSASRPPVPTYDSADIDTGEGPAPS